MTRSLSWTAQKVAEFFVFGAFALVLWWLCPLRGVDVVFGCLLALILIVRAAREWKLRQVA